MTLFCFINLYWLLQLEFMADNFNAYRGTKTSQMLDDPYFIIFYPIYFLLICNLSQKPIIKFLTSCLMAYWLYNFFYFMGLIPI